MAKPNNLSDRQTLQTKYNNARSNLLLVVVFTVINIILLILKSDTYFLFSASIPYFLVYIGMMLCGMLPDEYYGEEFQGLEFLDSSFFTVLLIVAIIITALYLISWIFSKNNKVGWLVAALVFFSIDTLGMFLFMGFEVSSIIDVVFHIWVIVSLCLGINACSKLKKLPEEEEIDVFKAQETEEDGETTLKEQE